jgi:hypothetical protein
MFERSNPFHAKLPLCETVLASFFQRIKPRLMMLAESSILGLEDN